MKKMILFFVCALSISGISVAHQTPNDLSQCPLLKDVSRCLKPIPQPGMMCMQLLSVGYHFNLQTGRCDHFTGDPCTVDGFPTRGECETTCSFLKGRR